MPKRYDPRVSRRDELSTRGWRTPVTDSRTNADAMGHNVSFDMGWGRLIFGQTFRDHAGLIEMLRAEGPDQRDVALYPRDPHVLVAQNPDQLFIDPSHTYRLWMERYRPAKEPVRGVVVRKMRTRSDGDATNRIYAANHMVVSDADVMWSNQLTETFTYLVAEDADTGEIIGTVTGVDHAKGWNDPESGSSLWCLAVHPQAQRPGVGQALVRTLAERYKARGRSYMDLSVMHDNAGAIALYEKLGFERVPVFCVKRKNPINEPLFTPRNAVADLNPYAKIVADEARRRGITVRVLDTEGGYLELSLGGREVITRESLSELTTAIAMSRCDDKRVTRRVLQEADVRVAPGRLASDDQADFDFLEAHGSVVVKPARGEQGDGVAVGITDPESLRQAIEHARTYARQVLLEAMVEGEDLRLIVIDHKVVAAAVRRPAEVRGTGNHTIEQLIGKQSRRRSAATGGEAKIPVDDHTRATIADAGYDLDDVLPKDELLQVRRTANLHTGGTIRDVTDDLHPELAHAAVEASRALDIPVVGLDFMVPAVDGPEYVCIEANERPGLANHEPQPTAQRFIDLLFPQTRARG